MKLFIRTNRGVTLTYAGQTLYAELTHIQKEIEQALYNVKSAAPKDKVHIRVGSSMMRPAALLMEICKHSKEIRDKYILRIIPFNDNLFNSKWLKSVIDRELDCVTSPYDYREWYGDFQTLKLGEEKFKLAVPLSHPLSHHKCLKLSDLKGCTLLTPPRQVPQVDNLCHILESSPFNIRTRTLGLYTANTFFEHPDELLLTRDSFSVISCGFETLDVDWDITSPTGLIYSLHPSPKMENFISLLKLKLG